MEGFACGARADCAAGMRCVRRRCVAEARLGLEALACKASEPWGWSASDATAGMLGAGVSGGGHVSWYDGGGVFAFALRGGVLFKNRFPLLFELGPEFDFGWNFETRGQLTMLVGAYAGSRAVAWAPKLGIGGAFGAGGFRDEYTFNLASLGVRTRSLVVDFDVFSYRIRRRDYEREWADDPNRGVEHRMITSIAFYKVIRRSR
jgi:hypothetical protein